MHTLLSFAAHQKQEMLLVASFSHHGFWNAVFMGNFTIVRHGLMLLWFKDLMNSTEKFQFRDPPFRHSLLVPSSGDFLGNSLLLAPLFPKPTTKKHSSRTAFSLLELFFSYCIVVAVAKGNLLNFARKVLAYPNVATFKARTWLAICEFLWLLTNKNVWFVTSLYWINLLLHWITWKLNLS